MKHSTTPILVQRRTALLAAASTLLPLGLTATAQTTGKPYKLVVGFPPGGSTDVMRTRPGRWPAYESC